MSQIPILYVKKDECCGCSACYAICKVGAIKMVEDEEGFLYPIIEEKLCVGCKRCLKVCPLKSVE